MKPVSRQNTLIIRTPEGIEFSILIAGPVIRFLAWAIDFMCIVMVSNVVSTVLGVFRYISIDFAVAAQYIAYFVISIGYSIVMEWYWRGQTVGKKVFRLRVLDEQGLRLQFSQIVIRNLIRPVDAIPMFYMVGGITCFLTRRSQRLGDLAANTIIAKTPRVVEPNLDQVLAGKYNSLRAYPHLGARLRQRVSPQEAGIALRAIMRRDQFEPDARVALFSEISGHFKNIVTFPEEVTEGISDEQYVRNIVDILFQKTK